MRCETFLDRYDELEPGERPGFRMARHLAACESCAAQVGLVEDALGALCEIKDAGDPPLEARVMASVRLVPTPQRDFSVRDWIIAGSVIAASMILIPVGEYFARFDEAFGASYALPLSLVLGLALTAYAALFVGTHMAQVRGFVDRRARQHP